VLYRFHRDVDPPFTLEPKVFQEDLSMIRKSFIVWEEFQCLRRFSMLSEKMCMAMRRRQKGICWLDEKIRSVDSWNLAMSCFLLLRVMLEEALTAWVAASSLDFATKCMLEMFLAIRDFSASRKGSL